MKEIKERHLFEEQYRICGLLGRGRFATVYKCMHKETKQYFAAKIVQKHHTRVDTEISILNSFRHNKNVISLFEVYQDSRESVLILELVSGGELLYVLGKNIVTEYDMTHVIKHLCSTLYCLHYKHIVHMDIKPENILICNTLHKPALRLVDFGFARMLQNNRPGNMEPLRGTPEFLAPEMLRCDNLDVVTTAVDMWCVGVTTYITLTGISPFQGDTDCETVARILHCDYYLGDDLFGGYSRDAVDFISKLLVPSPRARMTAAECLNHPWLSKKKRSKQRQYTLSSHVMSSVRAALSERVISDTMSLLKLNLRELSCSAESNIKPSTIDRNYKSSYK